MRDREAVAAIRKVLGRLALAGVLLVGLAAAMPAGAADPPARRFGIMSLIGDRLVIVGDPESTAPSFDRSRREFRPLDTDVMDRTALLAANEALKTANPSGPDPVLLAVRDPRLFAMQERVLDADSTFQPLLDALAGALAGQSVTHLVLISKYRATSSSVFVQSHLTQSRVEGLGFYIDRREKTAEVGVAGTGIGFLTAFAFIKVSLVETATLSVVREEIIREEYTASAARARESAHPWDALSPQEKVQHLRSLIERGVARAVRKVAAK